MADDGGKEGSTWPMPTFRFEADFGVELKGVAFQEISGMDKENEVMEYRANSTPFYPIEMPDLAKYGTVTMKRGIFVGDNTFWNWVSQIKMNTMERGTVTIRLLNENGKTTMQWNLANAWPTEISSADLKSDGNEVAVESLEVAYESMTISKAE